MAVATQHGQRGSRASRPQPQTTGEPGGGPFIRHSRRSMRPGYSSGGQAYGAAFDNSLQAAPGYLRWLDMIITASGGVNASTVTVTGAAGAPATDFGLVNSSITTSASSGVGTSPAAIVSFVQVVDAYGTPVFTGNGYEMLYLVPIYSGQVGVLGAVDLMKYPSISTAGIVNGTSTATTTTGNFRFHTRIPFEIVPGYGCLAVGNASLQPKLHVQTAASSALYSSAPSTVPTLTLTVDEAYWAVPVDVPDLLPPGLGTTLQWTQYTAQPTVSSATSARVAIPRVAGYITTLIFVARDTNGNRCDTVWPALGANNRLRLYLDGVPVLDEAIEYRIDKQFEDFGGVFAGIVGADSTLRPAGVLAYSLKNSESQANLGYLDSGETWISATPGTLVEIECTPWGSFSNGPAIITCIVGAIVPSGRGVQQGAVNLA